MRYFISMIFLVFSFALLTSIRLELSADAKMIGDDGKLTAYQDDDAGQSRLDWKDDEVCRLVFFAVLKGLYEDGVADDVVDSIIGPKSDLNNIEHTQKRMRISFVLNCPLCQPTFEAWLAYQNRHRFSDGSSENTFGDGLDSELRKQLLSEHSQTRIQALKVPVQKWVLADLKAKQLTREQWEAWNSTTSSRFFQGKEELMKLIKSDTNYREWSPYWGCAACNAAKDASDENGRMFGEKGTIKD